MGLFHFPLNELTGWAWTIWAWSSYGSCFLPLLLLLVFLPFLHPVPQTITFFFPCHHVTFFLLLSSCILVVLFLPALFLGGRSDLRPSLNDTPKKKKKLV